jgi:2-keto-3-deoxy-galactonokinase
MIRASFIAELQTENGMRRKVWKRIPGSHAEFVDMEHQRRYTQTTEMQEFFQAMTDREFYNVIDRIRRDKEAKAAQTSIF